jgi:hypothetical protein
MRRLCTVWPEPKVGNTQKYEVRDAFLDEKLAIGRHSHLFAGC